jgi:hypothetical protein
LWEPGKTTHVLPPVGGWGVVDPQTGIRMRFVSGWIDFHPDAFKFSMKDLAKDLADEIDRRAMLLYDARERFETAVLADDILKERAAKDLAFRKGDQWPAVMRAQREYNRLESHRMDILYGISVLKPELSPRRLVVVDGVS